MGTADPAEWSPPPIHIPDEAMARINECATHGWYVVEANPPQVIPVRDTRCHVFGTGCGCLPVDDGEVVVHNAFDGRERYEQGYRKVH